MIRMMYFYFNISFQIFLSLTNGLSWLHFEQYTRKNKNTLKWHDAHYSRSVRMNDTPAPPMKTQPSFLGTQKFASHFILKNESISTMTSFVDFEK